MENTPEQTVRQIMSDVLEVPLESVDDNVTMQNTDTWDSLRHMEIVVAIEEKFGVDFEALELMELTSLRDIMRMIGTKGVQV
jgi:acyl carrier protein